MSADVRGLEILFPDSCMTICMTVQMSLDVIIYGLLA